VDYALQRIERALETIDDSGGFRYGALEMLQTAHINTCNRLDWPKNKLTNYLLDIVFSNYIDVYAEIPLDYTDVLGDIGMLLFNDALQSRWDALPPLKQGAGYDQEGPYLHLQYLLEQQARLANDSNAIIKLKQKTATTLYDYQDLAELCLQAGDYEAVETWLAKCRTTREEDYYLRTERIQTSLFRARELWSEALEQQWEIYTKSLDLDDYRAVLELAESAGDRRDWRKKTLQFLEKQSRIKPRAPWDSSWADKRLEIHLHDEAIEEALAIATKEQINHNLLLKLAWKISNEPEKAFPLFQRVIEYSIKQTNNDAYRYAINLLQEIAGIMQSSQQKQQMMELLEHLRQKYRAKRNFTKWLNDAF